MYKQRNDLTHFMQFTRTCCLHGLLSRATQQSDTLATARNMEAKHARRKLDSQANCVGHHRNEFTPQRGCSSKGELQEEKAAMCPRNIQILIFATSEKGDGS